MVVLLTIFVGLAGSFIDLIVGLDGSLIDHFCQF